MGGGYWNPECIDLSEVNFLFDKKNCWITTKAGKWKIILGDKGFFIADP